MPKIGLSDTIGLGLIIAHNSGVIFTNQVGGTACLRPAYEGIYLALRNDYTAELQFISPEIDLSAYFEGDKYKGIGATGGIDDEDAAFIESVLEKYHLQDVIRVDRDRLEQSCEAWVHVILLSDNDLLKGFGPYPRQAVLTWANSD